MADIFSQNSDCFKAPVTNSRIINEITSTSDMKRNVTECSEQFSNSKDNSVHKEEISKSEKSVPLPYTEPRWSGCPAPDYRFEVIKNGVIISDVNLSKAPFLVFGRLESCDVVLEHPSVSRYHAVVQYCAGDETHAKGFYLYDLGSTHGTFLNKKQVTPKIYYKLEVGYVVKFGGSTRLHIFQGPPDEEEEEEVNLKQEEKLKTTIEDKVCDWGIGEDAEEEEDLTENPFALSTANEDLYLDDPKKTLRGWFEREGYELEYEVEEKGFKNFVCRVQLPIDTLSGEYVCAEASVSGKKKEAVVACALEACRILDRYGVLRQAQHESRKKKRKNWEDEDFYDSDEDTYLDRTGTIEKKREIRKSMEKKSAVETFESLENKLKSINKEISEIEAKLQNCTSSYTSQSSNEEIDPLDSFMSSIQDSSLTHIDKVTKSKYRLQLSQLQKEKIKLEKLLNIAKPTKLPPLSTFPGMIGKRPKKKFQLPSKKPLIVKTQSKFNSMDKNEEIEEEEEEEEEEEILEKICDNEPKELKTSESHKTSKIIIQQIDLGAKEETDYCSKQTDIKFKSQKFEILSSKGPLKRPISEKSEKQNKQLSTEETKKTKDIYSETAAEYSMWIPPTNQKGDGFTHLNAKYGY